MHNLIKASVYQLLRHSVFRWTGIGVFALGFFTADSYAEVKAGPNGGAVTGLGDVFQGMVYDSTFLLILLASVLAFLFGQEFSSRTIIWAVTAGQGRNALLLSRLLVYLVAFNLLALLYPLAGCAREWPRFGGAAADFFAAAGQAAFYSIVCNTAMFLLAACIVVAVRRQALAVTLAAGLTFGLSLTLAYGMMMHWPIAFLPIYQIRATLWTTAFWQPQTLFVSGAWSAALLAASLWIFRHANLR